MEKNWSNTALVAFSSLSKIVKEIDFQVMRRVKSSYLSRHLKNGVSTEQLICEIIEFTNQKQKLITLQAIVKNALEKMDEKERKILMARVCKKRTFQELATDFNLSLRTAFRQVANAEVSFKKQLKLAGYDESWFEIEYGEDKYISPIHDRIVSEKYTLATNL